VSTTAPASAAAPVVILKDVSLRYGKAVALDSVDLSVPAGCLFGLVGPDGVGKSSLLSLIAGARKVQDGTVRVLGGDMSLTGHREAVGPGIAYMPQGLGRNLYATLSVDENLQFFGRLFGQDAAERRRRIDGLTRITGLYPFLDRPAGKLSGGMRQKLGLCCALIHDPALLILDEPTTGVDPLSRRQFWNLIDAVRADRPEIAVIVATAYMDEASRFDWLVAMDGGRLLATGTPRDLLQRTQTESLEAAFIALLPEEVRRGHVEVELPPFEPAAEGGMAIEAKNLTKRFGDFVAVDSVNLRIPRGEIFGFLGSNGSGKTTTMKMLTGLLPASEGEAWLFGHRVEPRDIGTRRRVGYMSQFFSLYSELTVEQNLRLHARLFDVPADRINTRVREVAERFGLTGSMDALPDRLPLGVRQRLSLAVAIVHEPELLILDEPTSGVDPVARDAFWRLLLDLSRKEGVSIFISTHFMNEGERCDRISLMHAGKVLVNGPPGELIRKRGVETLEDAFVLYMQDAGAGEEGYGAIETMRLPHVAGSRSPPTRAHRFNLRRASSYTLREGLELRRDPVRGAMALLGSLLLMIVLGYGISLDVEDLTFAVLDRDRTLLSSNYVLNLSGSPYFLEQPPLSDYEELDRRMRAGELSLAIEIPHGFARDLQRGNYVEIGAWVDGAMPMRAETVRGYVQGIHQGWLAEQSRTRLGKTPTAMASVETRFRYNPDVRSLPAMVPAVIPILLLLIPAMLTALSIVREKELGSIVNFYVTPVTRIEFLLGKQAPYVVIGLVNFGLMMLLALFVFRVPVKGNFFTLAVAMLIFVLSSTGIGLLCSIFTRTQVAAIFLTFLVTLIPVVQYAGLMNPVSSLEGFGRVIGEIFPASYALTISRGVFSKALGFGDLHAALWPMALSVPVLLIVAVWFLRKQES